MEAAICTEHNETRLRQRCLGPWAVLGQSIALGMIAGGRARLGQTLYVPMPGGELEVEVTAPVFYDPTGARING